MATARPTASVFKYDSPEEKSEKGVKVPSVFSAPLRPDMVKTVHRDVAKNKRQAQGVKFRYGEYIAGYDTAAISWGTGRAVARIPRVPGGGTHRSGQGAFGNMCRGGGMFAPLMTWRKWHRKVNVGQKRHAIATAIAASGVAPLVMARGHQIDEVPELPLVVSDGAATITKTKQAVDLLKGLGCEDELEKCRASKKVRCGRGKLRNRRYVMRKGPLVVYHKDEGLTKALRNIPGVDTCSVERLNILSLAPGGHFGRFVVYTEGAMGRLAQLFGSYKGGSDEKTKGGANGGKTNYHLPRSPMTNTDIAKIINSNEVQSVLNPRKMSPATGKKGGMRQSKNMLKNRSIRGKLCPGLNKRIAVRATAHVKGSRLQKDIAAQKAKKIAGIKAHKKDKKAFFQNLQGAYAAAATEEADEE